MGQQLQQEVAVVALEERAQRVAGLGEGDVAQERREQRGERRAGQRQGPDEGAQQVGREGGGFRLGGAGFRGGAAGEDEVVLGGDEAEEGEEDVEPGGGGVAARVAVEHVPQVGGLVDELQGGGGGLSALREGASLHQFHRCI